jgi:Domain of unknown function (DUF1906)
MRRAAVPVLVAGAVLASGFAFTPVTAAVNGMKTVRYQGYQVSVPGNWPVYFLDRDPDRCVRYDVNAVYLGTPGLSQNCPAGLVGRADTISIGDPGAPDAAPVITVSYGTDPSLIQRVLASVRPGAPHPVPITPVPVTRLPDTPAPPPGAPTLAPSVAASPRHPLAGFDTCTAPSLHTMRLWRARFAATAIYIGGQMMACDYGNLSAGWVRRAEAMGWSLLPTYVGLQAPCDKFSGKISQKHAAAQGAAAANRAIADANAFGLGRGTPIYYDMEAYQRTKAGCVTAVLTFLDAWTRRLRARGYVSGVYASAGSAIADLQARTRIAGHRLARPRAVWFALWDNASNLSGSPYLIPAVWPARARSKQYAGPHVVKVKGISLDIDSDLVRGPVARR